MTPPPVAQCDRCAFVAGVKVGSVLPPAVVIGGASFTWEVDVLGEIRCPYCVWRAATGATS